MMARKIPEGANRGPRDQHLAVYLTKEEVAELQRLAKGFGFKSKSSIVVYILEDLIEHGMSGASFDSLGWKFSKLIWRRGPTGIDWRSLPFLRKPKPDPKDYDAGGPVDD